MNTIPNKLLQQLLLRGVLFISALHRQLCLRVFSERIDIDSGLILMSELLGCF